MQFTKNSKFKIYAGSSTTWHKSQIFFYLLAAFIVGTFVNSFKVLDMPSLLAIAIVGLTVVCFSFNNKRGLLIGFIILAFVFGGWRFLSFNNSHGVLSSRVGDQVKLIGYIDNEPIIDGTKTRFIFKTEGDRVLVTTNAFPIRKFGDKLSIFGDLKKPENFTDFDYITYLKKDGVNVTISFPKIETYEGNLNLSFNERIKLYIYRPIFLIKNKFEETINQSIPEPNASFINGILLGSRQNIPDDLTNDFKKTGTTHILAISGYNIMIISEMVLLGLVWFFRRRLAFWISVGVIILFVILTGASASVVRAAIMGLILSFANGYGRLYDQKNSIILAGGVMVLLNPMVLVFDVGFQLSFVAVLGIIYLYPWIDRRLIKIPNPGGLKELTLMTLSAQITVAPLLIYYFGYISYVSLPTNILILPFVPVAMLFGFIAGLVGMIFLPAGQILGYIAWAITTYQIWIVKYFSSMV